MAKAQYRRYPKLGLKGGCCHPWLGLKVVVIRGHGLRLLLFGWGLGGRYPLPEIKVVVIRGQSSRSSLSVTWAKGWFYP
jgi:hypothetical protein